MVISQSPLDPNDPPANSFVNRSCVKDCEKMLVSDPKYANVDAKYCYQICEIAPPQSPTPDLDS